MNFDPTKPCQTRDGRKVRILCTDFPTRNNQPIAGVVDGDCDDIMQWSADGSYIGKLKTVSPLDLINIPEKHKLTGWVNVYRDDFGGRFIGSSHSSKSLATDYGAGRIACLDLSKYNIEFEEGDGL